MLYICRYVFRFMCINIFSLANLHPPQLQMEAVQGCFCCLCLWECSVCLCSVWTAVCVYVVHTCALCLCVPAEATSSGCCWFHLWHGAATASAASWSWSVGPSTIYFSVTITFFRKRIFWHVLHGTLFTVLYSMLPFRFCFLDLQSASGIALI